MEFVLTKIMKILVADKISTIGVDFLKKQSNFEIIEAYGSSREKILEIVSDVSAIIVRSDTRVDAEVIKVSPLLKVIGRAGVGVDNIDVDAATASGVIVANTPSGNTIATAELTITHLLCGTRPIAQANASVKAGKWNRKSFSGSELNKKTLGILGLGRIGAEVAKRAKAFAMSVWAYDPYLTEERAKTLDIVPKTLDGILTGSDYITVHMPLLESTYHMIDEEAFSKMKDGVRIFNCARGGIIKESALVEAMQSGKVAAAGLDVYEKEPIDPESSLLKLDQLVQTPHLGASTKEAQESVGLEVAEVITEILSGGAIRNAINMPSVDQATLEALAPFMELCSILGTVVQQLAPEKVIKLEVVYRGQILDLDSTPLSRAIQKGYLRKICGNEVNDVNAPQILKTQGIEVAVIQSNEKSDYTDLIEITAIASNGETATVKGTLIGNHQEPRVVSINGRDIESSLRNTLLIFENDDLPGIVGFVGTVLGSNHVNIANMSLSRQEIGTLALNLVELDTLPPNNVVSELQEHPAIKEIKLVQIN